MDTGFTNVSLEEKDRYYELWQKTPRRSLDYSLVNLWGWQEHYRLEWQFSDGLCWIRQTRPETIWWAPVGPWHEVDWRAIFGRLCVDKQRAFIRVPEELLNVWHEVLADRIRAEEDRGQWEYLYLQKDLAGLAGNKLHKKRNHYNSYVKTYGSPDYRAIDDRMIQDVLSVQDDWCQWHECDDSPSLMAENDAVNRVLLHWNNFRNLLGGSLYLEGRMVAFSVGEQLDDETLGVHFEKGLNGFKGVYQAMNCEFARHAGEGKIWINRAQDMDEEGLRQAKLTYMPTDYLRKFKVSWIC